MSTADPASGCGTASCDPCPSANATAACDTTGACSLQCSAGFADCNGDPSDGCETETVSDASHCGMCGHVCPGPSGQAVCSGSACGLACPAGFADCNNDPNDGCERPVTTTTDCGTCNHACQNGSNAVATCNDGMCALACPIGFGDCNGSPGDGCEMPLAADVGDTNNCGACGHVCPAGFNCRFGLCGCAANDANCNAGAPAGTFACTPLAGSDKCSCKGVLCDFGQRCQPDGSCG
ncbi:Hypothetical protein A7982_08545 [Minicystis rosea]|nr:Hypothetical protein A7982_08545 [Minicystis rosea]